MSNYWQERLAETQAKLTEKTIEETEKQLAKYYSGAMKRTLKSFEQTYNKLIKALGDGKEPTPADLYKLDRYWQMQGVLRDELIKLGDKQARILSNMFMLEWGNIYESFAWEDTTGIYNRIDKGAVKQIINSIWCVDGKSWSARVWQNIDRLQETLNSSFVNCVITGKPLGDIKKQLMRDFNVSFNRADSIVRTEMAHIQTEAAKQRYKDYGLQEVEILADADERRCDVCGKLHGTRYPIGANIPIPAHPKCRCCIVPVVEPKKLPFDRG